MSRSNAQLRVERRGTVGIPVVLLHGMTIDHRMMLPLDPVIDAAGAFQRYYIDLPGHGDSSPVEPMRTDAVAAHVADAISAIVGSDRFALVGASFGGRLATLMTGVFGSQLLGTALLAPAVARPADRRLPAPRAVAADEQLLRELSAEERDAFSFVTAQQDRPRWELFAAHVLPGLTVHDQATVGTLIAAQRDEPWDPPQPHGGQHLIVTGKQDAVVGWHDQKRLLDVFAHSTFAALDRCGHNVHLEQPAAVHGLLTSWLQALGR